MTLDVDTGLSPAARSIIDAARQEEDPGEERLGRLRGRVFGHVGVAAAAGAATALSTSATAEAAVGAAAKGAAAATGATVTGTAAAPVATTASLGFFAQLGGAAKVGLAVLALGGATSGVLLATSPGGPPRDSSEATTATPRAAPPDVIGEVTHKVATEPAAATEPAEAAASEQVRSAAAPPTPPPATEATKGTAPTGVRNPAATPRPEDTPTAPSNRMSSEPGEDPLAEETSLLGRAQSALAAGRHGEALQLLDEHARRFPTGALAPEREGARWLALCGAGRAAEVRSAVHRFLESNPSSPLAGRLRAACGMGD